MSRLATSFVLGYHGCDYDVAEKAVLRGARLLQSNKDYDWLGPGAYFWESNPSRAMQWARDKVAAGAYKKAAVVGAVIDLGNCLDLVSHSDIELLRIAHRSFVKIKTKAGLPIPQNKSPRGMKDQDRVLRFLDCAVLRHLHEAMDALTKESPEIEVFHTVRGMFVEGGKAFPGSGIHKKSHVQIAVRDNSCIKGIFFPSEPFDLIE